MLVSGVTIAIPGINPQISDNLDPENLTPAEYFTEEQRPQFCGSSIAKSTTYVQEFSIPTICTNPLGITTDNDGNVWFGQTNTGNVAMFNPTTEEFTEYDNPQWNTGTRSMMWGMAHSPDNYIWYTDDTYDSLWRFSPTSQEYERIQFPADTESLPQRISIEGSQILVNDFTGNKMTILTSAPVASDITYLNIPSPFAAAHVADFAVDSDNNIWFTTWSLENAGGVLVKFDYESYLLTTANPLNVDFPLSSYMTVFGFPPNMLTPNGATFTPDGMLWLADTSSSSFYSFDPISEQFVQYVTADPLQSTYGNNTGVIKSPISRPYWVVVDDTGRLVFNAQNANNISVMDPAKQMLVEYNVPSKNPYWADCGASEGSLMADCGVAQIFDIAVDGEKIWFTEWVENNIGVVDTTVPLPFDVSIGGGTSELLLSPGDSSPIDLRIVSLSGNATVGALLTTSSTHDFINIEQPLSSGSIQLTPNENEITIDTIISVSENAIPGTYKVLLGTQTSDIAVGKFVTVTVSDS